MGKRKSYLLWISAFLLITMFGCKKDGKVPNGYEPTHNMEETSSNVDNLGENTGSNVDNSTDMSTDVPDDGYGELVAVWDKEHAVVGEKLSPVLTGDGRDLTYVWYKDGEILPGNTAGEYTVMAEDLEHFISVDIVRESETIVSLTTYVSKLPVMYINTENEAPIVTKEEYINAEMKLQGNALFNESEWLYNGAIEIKGRGNSTWKRFDKKPYKIKLDNKSDLLDMGENKHWVLLANYIDESLMRNSLAFDFASKLNLISMQSTWVDVVLNGKYIGNYLLCEQIRVSDERVDVKDWEGMAEDAAKAIYKADGLTKEQRDALEEQLKTNLKWITSGKIVFEEKEYVIKDYYQYDSADINTGYLIELSAEYDEISKFMTKRGAPIMIKEPEYLNTNSEMFAYVKGLINAFEDAIYSEDGYTNYQGKRVHYSELCNMDSLVDYWLVIETFYCPDAIWKSRYMYIGEDGLITFGPVWDFDFSSGANNPWIYIVYNNWRSTTTDNNNFWLDALIMQPDFVEKVYERYHEIRDTAIADLIDEDGTIAEWTEYLKESGAANTALWKYVQGFDKDAANLQRWLKNRIWWMDSQMKSLETFKAGLVVKEPDTGDTESGSGTETGSGESTGDNTGSGTGAGSSENTGDNTGTGSGTGAGSNPGTGSGEGTGTGGGNSGPAAELVVSEIENYDKQIAVLLITSGAWSTIDKESIVNVCAVTDMDMDGRLEVIVSYDGETEHYTYTKIYEVNEKFDGLEEVSTDFAQMASQPDTIKDVWTLYYNGNEDTIYYVLEDYRKSSPESNTNTIVAVKIKDNKMTTEVLAVKSSKTTREGVVISYTNAAGEGISEDEYLNAAANRFSGMNRYEVALSWQDLNEIRKGGLGMTTKKLLNESFESFVPQKK